MTPELLQRLSDMECAIISTDYKYVSCTRWSPGRVRTVHHSVNYTT